MKDADPDIARDRRQRARRARTTRSARAGAARRAQGRVRHACASAPPRRWARLATATSVDALIAAAKDKSPDVRRRVFNALGEIGDERALDTLMQALKDEDAAVRRSAAAAIAEICGGNASASAAASEPASQSATRIPTPTPIRIPTRRRGCGNEALASGDRRCSRSRRRRTSAPRPRGWPPRIRRPERAPRASCASSEAGGAGDAAPRRDARRRIARRRGRLRRAHLGQRAIPRRAGSDDAGRTGGVGARRDRHAGLRPADEGARRAGVDRADERRVGARRAGQPPARFRCCRARWRDTEPNVRKRGAWALGALDASEAVPALVEALKDSDAGVREQVAWALGAIGDRRGVDGLVAALGDSVAGVRKQAAWALGAIGDNRAVTATDEGLEGSRRGRPQAGRLGARRDRRLTCAALRASILSSCSGVNVARSRPGLPLRRAAAAAARRASHWSPSPRWRSASAPTPPSSASSTRCCCGRCLTPMPDRLAVVWEHNLPRDRKNNVVSPGNFIHWRELNQSFKELSAVSMTFRTTLTGAGERRRAAGAVHLRHAVRHARRQAGARPRLHAAGGRPGRRGRHDQRSALAPALRRRSAASSTAPSC